MVFSDDFLHFLKIKGEKLLNSPKLSCGFNLRYCYMNNRKIFLHASNVEIVISYVSYLKQLYNLISYSVFLKTVLGFKEHVIEKRRDYENMEKILNYCIKIIRNSNSLKWEFCCIMLPVYTLVIIFG